MATPRVDRQPDLATLRPMGGQIAAPSQGWSGRTRWAGLARQPNFASGRATHWPMNAPQAGSEGIGPKNLIIIWGYTLHQFAY